MDKEEKMLLLIIAVVFIVTFAVGVAHYWPYPKEAVVVGFDEQWSIGSSDFEVKKWDSSPIIEFEYDGNHYATDKNRPGLPVKPVEASLESMIRDAGNGRTFQKFLLEDSSDDDLFAVYVVVIGNDVYYSKEEIYTASNYDLSFEQKENQVTISHHPQTLSTLVGIAMAALFISCVVAMFSWVFIVLLRKNKSKKVSEIT